MKSIAHPTATHDTQVRNAASHVSPSARAASSNEQTERHQPLSPPKEKTKVRPAPKAVATVFHKERTTGETPPFQLKEIQNSAGNQDKTVSPFVLQKKTRNEGMPGPLKTGIENLSGMDISGVKVHYNSGKPAQLNAHAYAQGNDIHIASGQERHLPHEAWHVVQQRQGRVKPTLQMKAGIYVNDDKGLEKEADVMGGKAAQMKSDAGSLALKTSATHYPVVQRALTLDDDEVKELNHSIKRDLSNAAGPNMAVTQEAWHYVENLIATGNHTHTTQELAQILVSQNLITMRDTAHSHGASPHTLNPMPANLSRFSGQVNKQLKVGDGEHRRHVVGRHTLGQAVHRSKDRIEDIHRFVQTYGGYDPSRSDMIAAKQASYQIMQNHVGNLWVGDGGENSAIGFFTGDIYTWMDRLVS